MESSAPRESRFAIGELIRHEKAGYRGVIVDIDAVFSLSEAWYDQVARSRPPKDRPWYHVLVHDADHMTYVAERHLARDEEGSPIRHPGLDAFLGPFADGRYRRREPQH